MRPMCFLALLYQQVDDHPIVLAANRDERPQRAGTAPRALARDIWAGAEPAHGGTWLGVSAHGCVAAIANRRESSPPTPAPEPRSRGLLCLDVLRQPEPGGMARLLRTQIGAHRHRPFNLLFGNRHELWCSRWDGDELAIWQLAPGVHVLGNTEIDDASDPKVRRGQALLTPTSEIESARRMLLGACGDHGTDPAGQDAICVHRGPSPTLCCSLIALPPQGMAGAQYLHTNGQPCRSALLDYSALLKPAPRAEE